MFKIIIVNWFQQKPDPTQQVWCICLYITSPQQKLVAWHHPIGGDITSYNPYPLCTGPARWAQDGYADSDDGIHPRHQHKSSVTGR
jgi:hypothetical protein